MRRNLQDQALDHLQLLPGLAVTISIGMASNREAPSLEKIVSLADARLYEAKRAGKNQICTALFR